MNHSQFKIYKNKKVLIFGHTGFKGSWLSIWLKELGAIVYGASLNVNSKPSLYKSSNLKNKIYKNYKVDIRNPILVNKIINEIKPDFIFHLAAQALVLDSIQNPIFTFETNSIGTLNILNSLRFYNKNINVIVVTSDKCYENLDLNRPFKETDRMGGKDPYSASKGCAEIILNSFIKTYFENRPNIRLAIARAGNVIGGGDWSNNRLIPDCIKSIYENKICNIRSPNSTRPWQHVLEPLYGYLVLGYYLKKKHKNTNFNAFNFGPKKNIITVLDIVKIIKKVFPDFKYKIIKSSSIESKFLTLDCKKSKNILKWQSSLNGNQSVKLAAIWYKSFFENKNSKNIYALCLSQINEYLGHIKN